jgi:hypothetical protein
MSDSDEYDTDALLRCTECGRDFTTPSKGDGIKFDGVRNHGVTYHEEEQWDFEVENYSYDG